jgi:hypothetical protein
MDVRDQSQKIDQARNRYREAQEDLKASYDRDLANVKATADNKIKKQAENYDLHKTSLEEQNSISNETYSNKAREAIERSQNDFKNRIGESTSKFEAEKKGIKNNFDEKLSNLSESYKKSMAENGRYEDQVRKSLEDRYSKANTNYRDDFTTQIKNLDEKSKSQAEKSKASDRMERQAENQRHANEVEDLRVSNTEQKFKEVSRLKDDNENLRTTLSRENTLLKDSHSERVSDLLKLKDQENSHGQEVFKDLQKDIRSKNVGAQEKQNKAHREEAINLEKKFNEDIRNIQNVANQKIKGGTNADNLNDELKQTKNSYEGRLKLAHNELALNNKLNSEKEAKNDDSYKTKIKDLKNTQIENLAKNEADSRETFNKTVQTIKERNDGLIDRYKTDFQSARKDSEERLGEAGRRSKDRISEQRVEFGKVVNTMNDKNMESISALKDDYSKDKTQYIERAKKGHSDEKLAIKSEFQRQNALRETLYEQKLAEVEKQTGKIIENYENRISQIVRKAEHEVEMIKSKEQERNQKETQSNKIAIDMLRKENAASVAQLRDKYEGEMLRDRTVADLQINQLMQKYDDQITRERMDHQKELSLRLNESRSQFERLAKSVEMEKETQRNQYEQRIENMRIASLVKENSKKV